MSAASNPDASESFSASRWTRGNFFFPTRLVVSPQHVSRVKPRFFGSNEIVIESTGGTDPITSHGHGKRDAQRIRDLIEQYQTQTR